MPTYYVDPAATGANNGSSWTDAWTSLQSALDTAVAGDTVYCRGTQTLSADIDEDINDGAAGNLRYIVGVNGSGTEDGTQFTVDGNNTSANVLHWQAKGAFTEWRNVRFTNGATYSGYASTGDVDGLRFVNCRWDNANIGHGLRAATYMDDSYFLNCSFDNNNDQGLYQLQYASLVGCKFIGNTQEGASFNSYCMFLGCIFHGNGFQGIITGSSNNLINCVIDGNGNTGLLVDSVGSSVFGCRITNNGGYGIDGYDSIAIGHEDYNFLLNNTSGARGSTGLITAGASTVTSGVEGYNDRASDDFNLTPSATLRHAELDIDGTNKHFLSAGLHPDEPAGGGGGGVAKLIGAGGGLIG